MSLPPSATRVSRPVRLAIASASWALLGLIVILALVLAYTLSVDNAGDATREVLFNVGHGLRWFLYVSTIIVFAIIATGPMRRSKLWHVGKDEAPTGLAARKVFLFYGIGQGKLPNDLYASVMHLFIFWGWVVLFIGTLIIMIHADFIYFLQGRIYLAYSAILDVFGLVAFVGLVMALARRYLLKPPRLRLGSLWDDTMLLWLMLAIIVSGFLIESLRIGATELISGSIQAHGAAFLDDFGIAHHESQVVANPDWAPWSPVGYALAKLFSSLGMSTSTMLDLHKIVWWSHLPMALLWTAWLGYGKISHILLGSANVYMRDLSPPEGIIPGSTLKPITDFETAESFGAGPARLQLEAAHGRRRLRALRPLRIELSRLPHRQGALADGLPAGHQALPRRGGPRLAEAKAKGETGPIEDERLIAGDVVSVNTIWDCVTCGACETQCPVNIEHIQKLQDMRRYKVLSEGDMPPTAQAVLTQLEQRNHPWRGTSLTRTSWMEGLDIEVPEFDGSQEYLHGSAAPARWSTATCRSRAPSPSCSPRQASAGAAWVRRRHQRRPGPPPR